jgi:EmrB/QacA subfamily drug resistance transporter
VAGVSRAARHAPTHEANVLTLLREPARPALIREHRLAPWFAVGTVCFGAFMGQLDASVVTLAFPALQRQFSTSLAEVQWVSLAYLLVLIGLLVPVGRLSDRYGRKLSYLLGFVVFAVTSAACGFAVSLPMLIGLRVVQAAGAALLQANSVALVATSVPAPIRRAALGVQAAAQAVGLALGPVAGGILVSSVGWRWIFFINVPVGLVAVTAGWYLLPRSRGLARNLSADPVGALLLAAATTGMLAALTAAAEPHARSWAVVACAVPAVMAVLGFSVWERRVADPLLDLRLLAGSGLGPALFGAMCAYLVLFGPLVLIPQVLSAQGDSVLRAGLMLTALPAGFGLAALAGERLLPHAWSNRARCLAGGLLAACGVAALAIPAPHAGTVVWLLLTGVGLGMYIPANNADIMAAVPRGTAATAGGMVNMTRGFGTALGVAVVTLGLHAGGRLGTPGGAGELLAIGVLAVGALAATWAGHLAGARHHAANGDSARHELGEL